MKRLKMKRRETRSTKRIRRTSRIRKKEQGE